MRGVADNLILNVDQKRFLQDFGASPLAQVYYLAGGTALSAFYLEHRQSEDLDFFSNEPAPLETVPGFLRSLPGVVRIHFDHKFDRRIFQIELADARILKTEFTGYPFPRLGKETVVDGVLIDSLQDILAYKIMALTDRLDAKDYVDLYYALKKNPEVQMDRLIEDAERKFGVGEISHILQGRFLGDIPAPTGLYLTESLDPEQLVSFFRGRARAWISRAVIGPER